MSGGNSFWIAPTITAVAALIIGIANMVITTRMSRRQIEAAEKLAKLQKDLTIATQQREERRKRRDPSYRLLLDALDKYEEWYQAFDQEVRFDNLWLIGKPGHPRPLQALLKDQFEQSCWSRRVNGLAGELRSRINHAYECNSHIRRLVEEKQHWLKTKGQTFRALRTEWQIDDLFPLSTRGQSQLEDAYRMYLDDSLRICALIPELRSTVRFELENDDDEVSTA